MQLLIIALTRAGIPLASDLKIPTRPIPSSGAKIMVERIGYVETITLCYWRKLRSYFGIKHVSAHTFFQDGLFDNLK